MRRMMNVVREGVYFLIKNGVVVYIGESNNILMRIGQHIAEGVKDFDSFEIYPTSDRKRLEGFLIMAFKPKYNISGGGNQNKYLEDWFPSMDAKEVIDAYENENEFIPIRIIEDEVGINARYIISQSVKKQLPVCMIDGRWKINKKWYDTHKDDFCKIIFSE